MTCLSKVFLTGKSTKNSPDIQLVPQHEFTSHVISDKSSLVDERSIIMLDKSNWEDEGILFGWSKRFEEPSFTDSTPEFIAAKIDGGHGFVVKRLVGLIRSIPCCPDLIST